MTQQTLQFIALTSPEFQNLIAEAYAEGYRRAKAENSKGTDLITIEQASKIFDKPVSTLRDYVTRHRKGMAGGVRSHKSGRTVYFKPDELEADLLKI